MTDIPLIQPADMTKPYPPESGDFPASDHGSHGIREDDFIAMMEILVLCTKKERPSSV